MRCFLEKNHTAAKILHDRWSWQSRQISTLWPWHMTLIDRIKYIYCIIYIDHLKNIGHVILIDHMNYIGHIIFIDHRKYIDLPIHWRSCSGRQLTQVLSLISNTASNAAKLATRTLKEEWRMPSLFCVYLDQPFLLAPKENLGFGWRVYDSKNRAKDAEFPSTELFRIYPGRTPNIVPSAWWTFTVINHRKNCECCPGHYLIVNH